MDLLNMTQVLALVAGWLNGLTLPAVSTASVAAGLTGMLTAVVVPVLNRRLRGQDPTPRMTSAGDDLADRLVRTELLLADATSELHQQRQRLDQLCTRQEGISSGQSRASLRQAIALSRHGASPRQLVDACNLSQGEAHLIHNLYGRPLASAPSVEVH